MSVAIAPTPIINEIALRSSDEFTIGNLHLPQYLISPQSKDGRLYFRFHFHIKDEWKAKTSNKETLNSDRIHYKE